MPGTDSPELQQSRDYVAIATRFAREAIDPKYQDRFSKWVRLACQRHLDDLERAAKGWAYRFDAWHANDVCDFIEKLPHVEGDWCRCPGAADGEHSDRCGLIDLEPPQIFILVSVFGWRRVSDGKRRFSVAYIEMARKGAKSTLTAGVALYCGTCEGEVGPQIVIGATTAEQAGKVFNPAKAMVTRTPDLREAFDLEAFARSIRCGSSGGFIQPINSKGKTQDGWNPHVGILDELHAHQDRALFDVIKSAFGARKNPLLWIITTAGYNLAGVCYEQHTYLKKILEGVLEADHFFGLIFTLDEGDDPYDETKWRKANPMLGITPSLEQMRNDAKDAKASPASEGEFKTKKLNLWLNAANSWLNMSQWKICADAELRWEDFEGLDCFAGADLADKDDITAIVLAALDTRGRLLIKPKFYLPSAVLEDRPNRPDHAANYRAWEQRGHLELTEGNFVDHNVIEKQLLEWNQRFSLRRITFDQFAAAQAMASRINEEFSAPDGSPLADVLFKTPRSVTDPAKELEQRCNAGAAYLRHDDNPVLNWMASNVVVTRKVDGSIMPKKDKPGSQNKIDGIDAAVNAIAALMVSAVKGQSSVYETHGIRTL